mgnify:CR=1 FL=1
MELKTLDSLIPQYAENKSKQDEIKKLCDKENAEIKSIMQNFALPKYVAGEYKATYTIQKRESINEEMLLEIAHQFGIPEIVKTKEYIDFDALERAIYNNLIPEDVLHQMDAATTIKEVPTLKVSKVKTK